MRATLSRPSGRAVSPGAYTATAITLHWLMAAGIVALIALGLVMTKLDLPPARSMALHQVHKSIGITVLLLALVRLAWRLAHPPPPLPPTLPPTQKRLARTSHLLLYGFMLAMPLTGWAMVSASTHNIPTILYGLVRWPNLPVLPTLHDKKQVGDAFAVTHAILAWMLIALLCLHVSAALRHHLLLRDDVLSRMLGRRRA